MGEVVVVSPGHGVKIARGRRGVFAASIKPKLSPAAMCTARKSRSAPPGHPVLLVITVLGDLVSPGAGFLPPQSDPLSTGYAFSMEGSLAA
jgi:hypothetical protein